MIKPKNLGKTQEKCLFGHTIKQLLSNFEPWKSWKYKQLWELGPNPSCLFAYKKNVAWSFEFFVERKENHVTLLYHVFC